MDPTAVPHPTRPPGDRTASALQRLQTSRLRLAGEMLPAAGPGPGGQPARRSRRWARAWRRLRHRVTSSPAASVAMHAVESWWNRHPWRVPAEAAAEQAEQLVVPWVRRHPALAMAGAAVTGAGLVLGRRHLAPLIAARLRGLPGQLVAAGTAVLMQPTVQALLASWLAGRPAAANDEPAAQPP